MHGLLGTDCSQTWSFGCISLEGLSYCFACVVHCQLPGTKASHRAACSASQEARGHIDA